MPITSKYLFVASMDVDANKDALFNEVYDTEHIPNLLKVPGVRAVTRRQGEPFAVSIGGAEQQVAHEGPRYSALYEIDGPHVLVSPEWAQAVELGRWLSQVRPYPTPAIGGIPSLRSASERPPYNQVRSAIKLMQH